jgi:hypothetical protein
MDAFPDKILRGEVYEVAPLPDQQRGWMNPDLKVYKTLVAIDGTHDFLRTRMSCKVEILVRRLEDVLLVPIQVVANRGGRKLCYVAAASGPQECEVKTGAFTDTLVQIIDGLEEGQEVLLNPPLLEELFGESAFERPQQQWDRKGDGNTETNADQDRPGRAQTPSASDAMSNRVKQMDKNNDGKISLSDEISDEQAKQLAPLDVNKDGFIDEEELAESGDRMGGGPRGSGRGSRDGTETAKTQVDGGLRGSGRGSQNRSETQID